MAKINNDIFPSPKFSDTAELSNFHGESVGLDDYPMIEHGRLPMRRIPGALAATMQDLASVPRLGFSGVVLMPTDRQSPQVSMVISPIDARHYATVQLSGNESSGYGVIDGSCIMYNKHESVAGLGETGNYRSVAIVTTRFDNAVKELSAVSPEDRIVKILEASEDSLRRAYEQNARPRKIGRFISAR